MVIVECPWCLGHVALNEDESTLSCEDCSIHVEIGEEAAGAAIAMARAA